MLMWNVNFDTKFKMLSPRLQKFFENIFFNWATRYVKLSIYSTLFNHDAQKLEIQQSFKPKLIYHTKLKFVHISGTCM